MKITGEIAYRVFIAFIVVLGLAIAGSYISTIPQVRFSGRPEQSGQVEVVGKRINKSSSSGKGTYSLTYEFIVAFAFPDGTIKELEIDSHSVNSNRETVECSRYNSINESDRGTLIYQESKDIEERFEGREDASYYGRRFISFEKDMEYGGEKIEEDKVDFWLNPWFWIALGAVIIGGIFLMRIAIKRNKKYGL